MEFVEFLQSKNIPYILDADGVWIEESVMETYREEIAAAFPEFGWTPTQITDEYN